MVNFKLATARNLSSKNNEDKHVKNMILNGDRKQNDASKAKQKDNGAGKG